ncbi:hypothetical protein Aperf_G00000056091 [Anoplocephala perfoliata]
MANNPGLMSVQKGPNVSSDVREAETKEDFIEKYFTYKECQLFFPIITEDGKTFKCGCGELELHHYDEDNGAFAEEWSPSLIANLGSTNAFGVVSFYRGDRSLNKSAQYLRISDDDNPEYVIKLLISYWGILEHGAPKLCISVLGGLDPVLLESKQIETFREGLMMAAKATNAFVTTYGLNTGIARIVGSVIAEENEKCKKIKCIGISPWGYVRSHYNLIRSAYSQGKASIEYGVSDTVIPNEPISLNEDHSHYILVDNGIRNRFYLSNVSEYRDKLESLISKPISAHGCGVPVVSIVFGGGFNVLESVYQRVQSEMPVIVCGSTGGAADILQQILKFNSEDASQYPFKCQHLSDSSNVFSTAQSTELEIMLKELISECGDDKKPTWTSEYGLSLLKNMADFKECIRCINLGQEGGCNTLDEAITSALIDSTIIEIADQITHLEDNVHVPPKGRVTAPAVVSSFGMAALVALKFSLMSSLKLTFCHFLLC